MPAPNLSAIPWCHHFSPLEWNCAELLCTIFDKCPLWRFHLAIVVGSWLPFNQNISINKTVRKCRWIRCTDNDISVSYLQWIWKHCCTNGRTARQRIIRKLHFLHLSCFFVFKGHYEIIHVRWHYSDWNRTTVFSVLTVEQMKAQIMIVEIGWLLRLWI